MEPSLDSKPDLTLSIVRTASDAAPPPRIMRTPSPTPSEVIALKQKGAFNVRASLARSSRKQKICAYRPRLSLFRAYINDHSFRHIFDLGYYLDYHDITGGLS